MIRNRLLAVTVCAALGVAGAVWPVEAYAQRRAVRVAPVRSVVVVGAFYRPFFYDPWYPYFYGPYLPPYGYPGPYDASASLRLLVKPHDAEVFIDGYFAGTVDDFDGFFQRLRLAPGQHEIVIYREGYRSARQQLYLSPGATYKVRNDLVQLQPGETAEPRPTPPPGSQTPQPGSGRYERYGRGRAEEPAEARSDYGTISIRVQPSDAEILIDGERWQGSGDARLLVQVRPGSHRVEIRKDAYETFSSEVRVRPGETTNLNVSLSERR